MENRENLTDITFLIPIRIDSIIRLENLILSIQFLQKYFITNIKIIEADRYNNGIIERLVTNCDYKFIKDCDNIYHRTKYINILTQWANTPFIAIWDADIIIEPMQIIQSIDMLKCNQSDIAFPYNGVMLDVSMILREHFATNPEIEFMRKYKTKMEPLYNMKQMVGGAVFVNKEKYMAIGGDNEKYYGWGNEDYERFARWRAYGYSFFRANGPLYHLYHPRGVNSQYISNYHSKISLSMLSDAERCSNEELNDKSCNLF